MSKDYYETLGVNKTATQSEIKRAYKNLAKKYHPDLHKGNKEKEEKFKEINEAYKTLGDEKTRQNYDKFGNSEGFSGFNNQGFSGQGGQGFAGFGFEDFDLGDIFEGFFGGSGFGSSGRRQHGPKRGADLVYDIEIDLEDAFTGKESEISIIRLESCDKCNGTGADNSNDIVTCDFCKGSGMEIRQQRTPFGIFQSQTTCSKCKGSGKINRNPCKKCSGQGRTEVKRKVELSIPKGIESGTTLRLRGEGHSGEKGMTSGDLYVRIRIKPHKIFVREGPDLKTKINISFLQAILGDEIEVSTIDGKAKLKIPSGTQTGTVFRLKGKGMPSRYTNGDELIKVDLVIPERINKKQKELLQNYAKESPSQIGDRGFFSKLRDAFK